MEHKRCKDTLITDYFVVSGRRCRRHRFYCLRCCSKFETAFDNATHVCLMIRSYKDTFITDYFVASGLCRYFYCLRCCTKFKSAFDKARHICLVIRSNDSNTFRFQTQEYEESKRNRKSIDDLPENVIYQVMKKLHPTALCFFLFAYPRASSVHGVYRLWLRKLDNFNRFKKRIDKKYKRYHKYHLTHSWEYHRVLSQKWNIKECLRLTGKRRIDRLLQYKQHIACHRSLRLMEKKGRV